MSAVNEWVVREFFESLGYFVSQPRKHVSGGRQRTLEEELDLLVYKPTIAEQQLPDHLVWSVADLDTVARAVIGVRGWHTDRFYASTFQRTPELLRFAENGPMRHARQRIGPGDTAKVLCLPRLPAGGALKAATVAFLREHGIDGIISFRTMLHELVRRVDKKRNYEKSDLLQVIRLLKNYDLLSEDQLDLFVRKRHR
jgi:hypothetical protein